jgi:hypothetical protein
MNRQTLFVLSMAALGAAGSTASFYAASAVTPDGLVSVESRRLDEVYLRPNADLAAYHKVIIDPAQVAMRPGWLKSVNAGKDITRWLVPGDQERIVETAASTMNDTVTEVFKGRGYEIVTTAGPGVMRLVPSVAELDVYAPDVPSPGIQNYFTKNEAGTATLRLEARDAVTGAILGRVVDRSTAREIGRINRTTSVSNVLWFQAMFRQWALNCATELQGAQAQP